MARSIKLIASDSGLLHQPSLVDAIEITEHEARDIKYGDRLPDELEEALEPKGALPCRYVVIRIVPVE